MHALLPIALNTLREARRNRVFYAIIFFAVALIASSIFFTDLTFAEYDRILRDTGFATMDLFGVALGIFLGVGMVNREIEKKTIYTVITKPVPRWAFIAGKDLGLMLTLLACMALMLAGFLLTLVSYRSPIEPVLFEAFYTLLLELAVVTAFAIFCSTWTSSVLSALFAVSFFIIGHLDRDIHTFGARSKSAAIRHLSSWIYTLLPDLERFNLKGAVTYLKPESAGYLLGVTGYAALWTLAFLLAAILVFQVRDFR